MKLAKLLDGIAGRIERAEVLDKPGDAIAAVSEKLLGGRQTVTDLASGTPLGHPVHPLLVAIPIGSWTSAHIFDLLGDDDAASTSIAIGVLAAVPTMLTGHSDWSYTTGGERRIGSVHAALNNVATYSYLSSWFARRAGRRGVGIVLSLVGASALGAAGWLGGHLAYALGVGVDTTAFQHSEEDWTPIAELDELVVGRLHAADVDGVPVVAVRTAASTVTVLADRCTHRGAPMHEGALQDGCLVCPWHASAFALDGSVVRGPATRPQPAYEVRIDGGQVLVRRPDEPRSLRTNPVGV